jgi:uncharacterized alpha-E superfamily protein
MLSRIAEALFWIGRYVERADNTARILDAHTQLLLEDPWADTQLICRSLLTIMSHAVPDGEEVSPDMVLSVLARDIHNASSIVGSLIAARENARRARESISSELWECLNTTRNEVAYNASTMVPHEFFVWVRSQAAIVSGLVDSSTSRDATWHFMVLGRSIERADMTARLLTIRAYLGDLGPGWPTLLRSCGAFEAFLRARRGTIDEDAAAGFLLRDRLFPRSIVSSLALAHQTLRELEPAEGRRGIDDEAIRQIGIVRTDLEYSRLDDILSELPSEMARVQLACSMASQAISDRYFPAAATTKWIGEAL